MKNKVNILITFLFVSVLFGSCDTDDFLDEQPTDELFEEIYWTNEDEVQAAVNGAYRFLRDDYYRTFISGATDDSYAWSTWPADVLYVGNGAATTTTGYFAHFWEQNYKIIGAANLVLDNIDQVEGSDSTLNVSRGEAMSLRAYAYQQLIGLYGDVPLVDHVQSWEELKPELSTRETIATWIVDELTQAAEYLPVSYPSGHTGRITKGAALAIKARVLLYEGDWPSAAAAAEEVIELGSYSIDSDYLSLFDGTNKQSPEILLAAQYLTNSRNAIATWVGGPAVGGWSQIVPLQSLIDAYEMTDGMTKDTSPLYDENNPFENRDPRLAMTVILPGGTVNGVVVDVTDTVSENINALGKNNASYTGYYYRKYVAQDIAGDWGSRSYNDEVLIRYAEVLLTYAEAKIEAGQIDGTVLDAINQVRQRSGVEMPAVTTTSAAELREIIRRERRVEFALEEHRLFDIRRWRIAENVMPGTVYGIFNDFNQERGDYGQNILVETRIFDPSKDYLWPIPQQEMDLNENLKPTSGWY
ncbi:RagB/SusD family nutrient uptake outer membrane protein [Fulvivirga sediminis]|uniref:RagB/SusD family nutrient uptake outer membrane protein n=1 Tax=Fulvivirga sediminis TaxID=2803949 RepID=A0A937K020_9BACT|nr:RagB/SusD family nutrient uptake outer membrane protein [Fulvivirga sediminis]MBL3655885.1 RagB/SusD family nutrient uptake outer membrane protein [Fulvivirga sediminis]